MNFKELKTKNKEELQAHLLELCKEQFNLNMQKSKGELNQPHLVKITRRNIARVKTLLNIKGS